MVGIYADIEYGPQWTRTYQCTIRWMPVITQSWMNLNWSIYMMKVFLVDVSGEGPLHNGEVLWKNAWTEGDVVIRGYWYEKL